MKQVVLNKLSNSSIILRAITEEQKNQLIGFLMTDTFDSLEDEELQFIKNSSNVEVMGAGLSNEVSFPLLQKLIPRVKEFTRKNPSKEGTNSKEKIVDHKCYAGLKPSIHNNIQIHEDVKSSFNCALNTIGKPEYCLITKEYEAD